jgi:hypothetical protein
MEKQIEGAENMELTRTYGPKRDDVTRCWTKFHNMTLHNLYSLVNIITVVNSKRIRMEAGSTHGEM